MKIVVAFVVLMSVAAASANVGQTVKENVKVYNPTLSDTVTKVIEPINPVRPIKPRPIKQ